MMGAYGWMGAGGGVAMLIGVLAWPGVIAVLVWGAGSVLPHRRGASKTEALDTLKRRFAAGEISAEEFETARRALA